MSFPLYVLSDYCISTKNITLIHIRDSRYFGEMIRYGGIDYYGVLSMPNKVRQISVAVYLDENTKKRFNKAIRLEQDREIEEIGVSTISKSNFCEAHILKWLDKNYPE